MQNTITTIKRIAQDYKESLVLILDNRWLYGSIIFFALCDLIYKIPQFYSYSFVRTLVTENGLLQKSLNEYSWTTFSDDIYFAVHSIHPLGLLDSMTFTRILFSLAGIIIAFIIFYKKIKPLRSVRFCKKISFYSLSIFLLSILSCIVTYFLIKNEVILMLSAMVGMISFTILIILLQTTIEAIFISLVSSLLKKELFSLNSLSESSIRFIKPLFIFNVILMLISGNFIANLEMFPDYMHQFIPNIFDYASDSVTGLVLSVDWFVAYFHTIFTIVFILTPLIVAITSHKKIIPILKESILTVRRELNYYLPLTIWTLLVLFIFIMLSKLIDPVSYSHPVGITILQTFIYDLLFTLALLTFYVTAFKKILGLSKKD